MLAHQSRHSHPRQRPSRLRPSLVDRPLAVRTSPRICRCEMEASSLHPWVRFWAQLANRGHPLRGASRLLASSLPRKHAVVKPDSLRQGTGSPSLWPGEGASRSRRSGLRDSDALATNSRSTRGTCGAGSGWHPEHPSTATGQDGGTSRDHAPSGCTPSTMFPCHTA